MCHLIRRYSCDICIPEYAVAKYGRCRQIWEWEIVNPDDTDQDNETKLLNYCIAIGPVQAPALGVVGLLLALCTQFCGFDPVSSRRIFMMLKIDSGDVE
ncbi:hypothetical protein TNCV_781421 [Trichonephila clavipes]|nr:hypothetical protein TNCV_781421 [Trichonephila clavipes]